jgi:predicted nucleotidyltransferase
MFSKDFKEFIELLVKNEAEYLIVGGYAVAIHGYPRYTGDLDIWINRTEANAEKILKTLRDFGFYFSNLSIEDFTREDNVIQLGNPPFRIDLLTQIDGVVFEECYANKKVVDTEGLKVDFISYNDLRKNKAATGRLRDQTDLENLKP